MTGLNRLEQRGAQRGRERQRQKGRKANRRHHHGRKLAVNIADRPGKKRQRHKHRDQHHGHADDGAGNLAHRLARGFERRQALFAHDALDVFDHHNRVIDDDTDDQHHAEHRQHVDRKAQRQQRGKGSQQRHRHDDGRNDGIAPVLQKQKHHQKHQHNRLDQRLGHLADGDFDKARAVVGNRVVHALGKVALEFVHFGAHGFGGGQRVAAGRELQADAGGRFAVQARRGGVGLRAQFDAGHVFETHAGAVGVGAQHDVAELLDAGKLAVHDHGRGNALPSDVGQIANRARGNLRVLRRDGLGHVRRRQRKAGQLGWINPDTHGALGAEQLRLADAGQALEFRNHVARGVVAQRNRVNRRIVRRQHGEQQEVRARFVHAHALLRHRRRQARRGPREAVLHIDLRQIRAGAGFKGQRQRAGAVGLGDRLHVDQAGRAVHLALNDAQDAVFERLGGGAGIAGGDHNRGRRDRRVLGNRQLGDGNAAHHDDKQRNHPRKNGALNKKLGHAVRSLLRGC